MTREGRLKLLNSYQTRNKLLLQAVNFLHKKLPVSLLISYWLFVLLHFINKVQELLMQMTQVGRLKLLNSYQT